MENEKMLEILRDAYMYHANSWLSRQSKEYKQKAKKENNKKLIQFNWKKKKEYNNIIKNMIKKKKNKKVRL